jgi:hypothetical protein
MSPAAGVEPARGSRARKISAELLHESSQELLFGNTCLASESCHIFGQALRNYKSNSDERFLYFPLPSQRTLLSHYTLLQSPGCLIFIPRRPQSEIRSGTARHPRMMRETLIKHLLLLILSIKRVRVKKKRTKLQYTGL